MNRAFSLVILALLICLVPDAAQAQCALCRDAVAAAGPQVKEAMSYAIIGLALTPYVVAFAAAWTLSPAFRALIRSRLGRPAALKTEPGS